ncbi:hypothetical protein MAQ5080_02585 [Marinomonas aquimarina]|uniref:Uncharacterized protein n=1 Tax=Marinomonas aquimarina TaxID=295068 RepID=A0A1A8TLR6_9GAMM|nr:hypothetical protein [Marinomonas aquimarina]SBS33451.1 hypothetical protein MAQ5080_02585 [Marinomonas aquimarina]
MSIHLEVFAGSDIRVAELQEGRYFNKADLLRVSGQTAKHESETQYLDILEASKLLGYGKESMLEAMQLWAPHLCRKHMVEVH